jgi:primase-polymerase (primpol)-like protein
MNLDRIPKELRELNQWVCSWEGSKVPMDAQCYASASSTNPLTWSDFENARKAIEKRLYNYVGFVFNDNGIVGIDIDTGYDDDGFLSPLACDIIGRCKSYTEKSKSGRGFHILIKGDIPFKGKNNLNGVEIYKQSRFFIMTGDVILYDEIIDNQEAIDYILETYFPELRDNTSTEVSNRIYAPVWEKSQSNKITIRPTYPAIPDGCRNICLTSLAGMLHTIGYNARQIYDELVYCNKVACEPPLPERELQTIVNSVTRYRR